MSIGLNKIGPENQKINPTAAINYRNSASRPPIPGSENTRTNADVIDRDFSGNLAPMGHETSLKPAPSPWEGLPVKQKSKQDSKMAPSPQAGSEAGSGVSNRGFEPEGSADVTPPFSESNSANSSPAYLKWTENLHNLLSDPDGVELYKAYMRQENVGELLDFWFACEGLKRLPSDQSDKIYQIIKVINKKFLRSKLVPIGEETRKLISDKIAAKSGTDQSIFDSAQVEVEERMTRTTYRNFLSSDMYISYIQNMQVGDTSDQSPKPLSGSQSNESSISGQVSAPGPGHDDSGHYSALAGGPSSSDQLDRNRSSQSTRAVSSALSNFTSDSTSGVSEGSDSGSHKVNQSVVTPAAPNSSMTAVTADTSMLGSDEPPAMQQYNMSQMSHSSTLPTLHEYSELDLETDNTTAPSLPVSLINSLTQASLNLTSKKRHQIKPEGQAGEYLQQDRLGGGASSGGRVPHPYHAYTSAYNPVSRQDSELQSLSSDAHTTDDNMSSFTESSSHYSNHYRLHRNKRYLRKQIRQNREHHMPQANTFIPRTDRIPVEASHQLSPAEFAEILIKKLEKVKREQELDEKLNKKLAEDAQSMVSQGSNRSLAEILREKLIVTDDFEGDQSILDDHVSRIWTDKTPLRSPGDPSGRPRSPGYSRDRPRGHPQQSRPGLPMGPPPPRRSVAPQGHPRRGGPVYQQDLAYYDLGGPGPAQAPAPGAGVNERVREWMLDVERQSADTDQRSHSSKTKTSPRSNRIKSSGHSAHSGHRSVSQERMMSTSWTGGAGMVGGYPPQQGDGDKRRLGASLVMPPPSQSNTLRKPAPPAAGELTIAVYTFSHEKGEPMPYRIKIPTKNVTLRHVKDFLPKKGAFRFYFKTEIDGDMCYEEETEDSNLVPLWEGKILVQCRLVE